MKRLVAILGGVIVGVIVLLLILRVTGFNPGATAPGLWIRGEVTPQPADWSFAEKVGGLTQVQTRQWFMPMIAHSVTTSRFVHDGKLYLASGYPAGIKLPDGRHWNRNVLADPHVRIKIGDRLYDGVLVYVSDPAERLELLRAWGPMMLAPGFFLHMWRVMPTDEAAS